MRWPPRGLMLGQAHALAGAPPGQEGGARRRCLLVGVPRWGFCEGFFGGGQRWGMWWGTAVGELLIVIPHRILPLKNTCIPQDLGHVHVHINLHCCASRAGVVQWIYVEGHGSSPDYLSSTRNLVRVMHSSPVHKCGSRCYKCALLREIFGAGNFIASSCR